MTATSHMLSNLRKKFRRIFSRNKVIIVNRFPTLKSSKAVAASTGNRATHPQGQLGCPYSKLPIRIATFNVAMFSLAPAIPQPDDLVFFSYESSSDVSLENCSKVVFRSPISSHHQRNSHIEYSSEDGKCIADVLREVDADILALQDVKAEQENDMKPLSDLAAALGMFYVFAESWSPEYGNAILSKWPIIKSKVQKIAMDVDFRNLLKATIYVPWAGEVNIYCTQLDYLLETWRMKQIRAIIHSSDSPHILAGGLNALTASDYSSQRWIDITKYFEEIGKPAPEAEVMNYLKRKKYADAKDSEMELHLGKDKSKRSNIDVKGTCKHGTRVDYILTSRNSPYKFVPGSYSVISSEGTSDRHIVKVDIVIKNI